MSSHWKVCIYFGRKVQAHPCANQQVAQDSPQTMNTATQCRICHNLHHFCDNFAHIFPIANSHTAPPKLYQTLCVTHTNSRPGKEIMYKTVITKKSQVWTNLDLLCHSDHSLQWALAPPTGWDTNVSVLCSQNIDNLLHMLHKLRHLCRMTQIMFFFPISAARVTLHRMHWDALFICLTSKIIAIFLILMLHR